VEYRRLRWTWRKYIVRAGTPPLSTIPRRQWNPSRNRNIWKSDVEDAAAVVVVAVG
jgi:hypothetical protein